MARDSLLPADIEKLARRVVEANAAAGRKVALAESCTGGLVSAALTEIPGSSDVVERGFATYSNEAKEKMLGVPREDWPRLFDWTNRLIGFTDPEFQDGDPKLSDERAIRELFAYFSELAKERAKHPGSDLASVLVAARTMRTGTAFS